MAADKNVAIVRRTLEAFNRGEAERSLESFHPDVEWEVSPELVPDADIYRGRDGVRAFWSEWQEAFEGFRLEIEDCVDLDDGQVLALTRALGVGAGSRAAVGSARFAQVYEMRDDVIVRVRLFPSRSAAIGATRTAD